MLRLAAIALVLAACQKTSDAPPAPPPPKGHLELIDAPELSDVAPYIQAQVASAKADHKQLLVYEGATWCEPCQRFHAAAAAGQLDDDFPDLRLLVFDAARDSDHLDNAGYYSEMVPQFAIPGADGRSIGKQIEGSVPGDAAIADIVPRLRDLLAQAPR